MLVVWGIEFDFEHVVVKRAIPAGIPLFVYVAKRIDDAFAAEQGIGLQVHVGLAAADLPIVEHELATALHFKTAIGFDGQGFFAGFGQEIDAGVFAFEMLTADFGRAELEGGGVGAAVGISPLCHA